MVRQYAEHPGIYELNPKKDATGVYFKSEKITAISLSGPKPLNYPRVSFKRLLERPDIKSIRLVGTRTRELHDVAALQKFPELVEFQIYGGRLTEFDSQILRHNQQLIQVDLGANKLKTINLEGLRGMPRLEKVDLAQNRLEQINLEPLSACPELRDVRLGTNPLKSLDLEPLLSNCPYLNTIDIGYYTPAIDTPGYEELLKWRGDVGGIEKVYISNPPKTHKTQKIAIHLDGYQTADDKPGTFPERPQLNYDPKVWKYGQGIRGTEVLIYYSKP